MPVYSFEEDIWETNVIILRIAATGSIDHNNSRCNRKAKMIIGQMGTW